MDGRTDGRIFVGGKNVEVAKKSFFAIGGTNVVFSYRWYKYRGGTNVGGTNVGGTNVGGTNVGGKNVGRKKVGPPFLSESIKLLLMYIRPLISWSKQNIGSN